MKKITTIITLIAFTLSVFGQFLNPQDVNFKTVERTDKQKKDIVAKTMNCEKGERLTPILEEDFEGVWPPTDWIVDSGSMSNEHWDQNPGDQFGYNGTMLARCHWETVGGGQQNEWLITPTVNIASTGNPVRLRLDWLTTYYWMHDPNDNANMYIKVSNDGGSTWDVLFSESDTALVEATGVAWPWSTYEWNTSFVDFSAYIGDDVQIAFQYFGNDAGSFYIDNILLYEVPDNDIEAYEYHPSFWYTNGGSYTKVPAQLPMKFRAYGKARNIGNNTINDAYMQVEIHDGNSVVFSETSQIVTSLDPFATDSFTIDTATHYDFNFTYPGEIKSFTSNFKYYFNGTDDDTTNNISTFNFETTDSIYARDNGYISSAYVSPQIWQDGGNDGDMFGVTYTITDTCVASSISFAVSMYSWQGATVRGVLKQFDGTEWSDRLSTDVYTIDTADCGNWVTLPYQTDGFSENLDAAEYIVGLNISFNGTNFYVSEDNTTPQENLATRWSWASDPTDIFAISNYSATPMIRLNIEPANNDNSAELLKANNNISLFPNPAKTKVFISNPIDSDVSIYNMLGDIVAEYLNISGSINISELSSGTYIFKVVQDDIVKTEKITITK